MATCVFLQPLFLRPSVLEPNLAKIIEMLTMNKERQFKIYEFFNVIWGYFIWFNFYFFLNS